MKKEIVKYSICCLTMVLLITAAIFMPQYYSKVKDAKYLNKVTLQDREKISLSNKRVLSLEEKIDILTSSIREKKEFKSLLQNSDSFISESKLIESIKKEVTTCMNLGLFPYVNVDEYEGTMLDAVLYKVDSKEEDKSVMFWYVSFGSGMQFQYSFCVDAYDYTIYAAQILNSEFKYDDWGSYVLSPQEEETTPAYNGELNIGTRYREELEQWGELQSQFLCDYYGAESASSTVYDSGAMGWNCKLGQTEFYVGRDEGFLFSNSPQLGGALIGIEPLRSWMFSMNDNFEYDAG